MTGRRSWIRAEARALLPAAAALAAACGDARSVVLVVYAPWPEAVLESVEEQAETAWPEVDVRFVRLDDDRALERIRGGAGQGDVWWGTLPRTLESAAEEELLAPSGPYWAVGERGEPQMWHAAQQSPYVLAFNRERTPLGRAPRDWVDLRHTRWRGEVVMADPEREPDAAWFVASALRHWRDELGDSVAAWDRLLELDAVTARYLPDTESVFRALRTGDAAVAVVTQAEAEAARHGGADWLYYRHPESGAPVAVRGVAVLAGAPEPGWAGRFLEMVGTEAAETVVRTAWWLPPGGAVPADVTDGSGAAPAFLPGSPRLWPLDAPSVARDLPGVVERWSLEVRGRGRELY